MFTVEWNAAAYEEFREMCLHANREDQDRIRRATFQIDQLLHISPRTQGTVVFSGQLRPETLDQLSERMEFIPEVLRRLRVDPIEVFFTDHEDEGRVIVWSFQRRS